MTRNILGIALAIMLALTGQSMAVARGAAGPAGQMVLCTGTGPVSVFVDENGAPTGPPHYCPDCVLSLLDAAAAYVPSVLPVRSAPMDLPWPDRHVARPPAPVIRALARAPPVTV